MEHDADLLRELLKILSPATPRTVAVAAPPRLSPREMQTAILYSYGLSHKEIARLLGVTPATARNYLQRIYQKLNVSNKVGLLRALQTFLETT